ncbi:MAG TPA: hypothetical protein VGN00_29880 [Puia sp.]|jgi:hypothetical protein
MTKRNIIPVLLTWCIGCQLPVFAQSSGKQPVMAAMQSLAGRYAAKKNLSFSVVYRYSTETRPGVYLDSLKGRCEISGDRYKYRIDSTEFLSTKDISVILFRTDKLIYLAKPSAAMRSNNPLALLDSLLWKKDSVDGEVVELGELEKIVLRFKAGGPVKRIEYVVDRSSGLLIKATNTIDSRQLYDVSVRSKIQGPVSYINVEADFVDYREGAFPGIELDPTLYVKKVDGQFITQAPYQSYKIFLANPDL